MELYEKKYKEALERMKSWAKGEHPECFTEAQKTAEFIFPELKESDDDRIRKEILAFINRKKSLGSVNPEELGKSNSWIAWLEKQGKKDEEILILKDQIESLHAAIKALKETHRIELEKQDEKTSDKIVEKARTEKQRVLLTETDGSANIDWDCRSLDDVKILLKCGLEFIRTIEADKQILTDSRFGGCSIRVPTRYDKGIKQNEQKSSWSEEDEKIYQSIMDDTVQENQLDGKQIDWLRNIKYRHLSQPNNTWKPSDEQITWLYRAADDASKDSRMKQILNELLSDLKKLREE